MKKYKLFSVLILISVFAASGCTVRTYSVTKDRLDQDLSGGNRGYLKGESSQGDSAQRKSTRTVQMVEMEIGSPIKFEKAPKQKQAGEAKEEEAQDTALWGNRGYINEGDASMVSQGAESIPGANFEKYTVGKGDTLQKISGKFYGTTKKWNKIYDANKDTLRGPDKIYPGQVLNIPTEPLKETKENLK